MKQKINRWRDHLGIAAKATCTAFIMFSVIIGPAAAQDVQKIAVVVNDEVISRYDVDQRLGLVVASTGVNASGDALERLRMQVVRSLIDEKLQLQEAESFDISASTEEVDEALASIASQNNYSADRLGEILGENGIDIETLRDQLKAEIAWQKLVTRRFFPRLRPGEEQIEQILNRIKASAGRAEHLVSEIFLGVDSPEQDAQVRATAERIVQQLRAGAGFPAMARQFSQASSASVGGEIGWVQEGQLAVQIDDALETMSPGEVSEPIRTVSGYYILLLQERRRVLGADSSQVGLHLKQAVVRLSADAPQPQVLSAIDEAEQLRARLNSCDDMDRITAQLGAPSGDLGVIQAQNVPAEFRQALAGLDLGEPSQSVRTQVGYHILMICGREMPKAELPTREIIEDRLMEEQLALLSRRYLRDLRRDAVIEFR